jgi:GNAT superfamily N-acetyltransferase
VARLGEEDGTLPTMVDTIRSGRVSLVVNTPSPTSGPVRDAAEIRLAAIGEGILCLTSVDTALAAARSLEPSVRERIDEIGTLEEWLARDMQGASDDPNAVFVALEGETVVGYGKLSLSPDVPHRAFHDLIGVRRSHRGRGIAGTLKRTQIAWAKRAGYGSLQTSNEVRNEPIRRLNEKHGYVLEPGVVTVRGAIAAT